MGAPLAEGQEGQEEGEEDKEGGGGGQVGSSRHPGCPGSGEGGEGEAYIGELGLPLLPPILASYSWHSVKYVLREEGREGGRDVLGKLLN